MSGDLRTGLSDSDAVLRMCDLTEDQLIRLEEVTDGRSHGQLARELQLNSETIRRYRRGMSAPSVEFLGRIALVFGVNLNWLLLGEGPKYVRLGLQQADDTSPVADAYMELADQVRTIEDFTRQAAALRLLGMIVGSRSGRPAASSSRVARVL